MLEMFVAACFLFIVLTLVLIIIIRKSILRLNEKVKEDFIHHLSIYDQYTEDQSKRLQKLKIEIAHLENIWEETEDESKEDKARYIVLKERHASYADMEFREIYKKIQAEFKKLAYSSMSGRVKELSLKRRDLNVHEYREIQEIFDHELQYQVFTLSPHDQKEIMSTIAANSVAKKRILDAYSKKYPIFNFKEFMEFIEAYIFRHDSTIYVFSSTGEPCLENAPKQVVFCKDERIAEGYIIRYQDQFYDYSL